MCESCAFGGVVDAGAGAGGLVAGAELELVEVELLLTFPVK